jgi:hypothetical protein
MTGKRMEKRTDKRTILDPVKTPFLNGCKYALICPFI